MENKLFRVVLHWSVGSYVPNADDLAHYHYLVDNLGNIHKGDKPPESNLPENVAKGDGHYVSHLGGGNSGTVGISMASMLGYKSREDMGKFPFTEVQFEKACELMAEMCHKYNIEVTPDTVFSHMEFGIKHPESPSAGKIDISVLPYDLSIKKEEIGDLIRSKVKWYLTKK